MEWIFTRHIYAYTHRESACEWEWECKWEWENECWRREKTPCVCYWHQLAKLENFKLDSQWVMGNAMWLSYRIPYAMNTVNNNIKWIFLDVVTEWEWWRGEKDRESTRARTFNIHKSVRNSVPFTQFFFLLLLLTVAFPFLTQSTFFSFSPFFCFSSRISCFTLPFRWILINVKHPKKNDVMSQNDT